MQDNLSNCGKDLVGEKKHNPSKLNATKNQLQIQEERTKQAFLENEAAEKETERKLRHSWTESDGGSVENLTEKVKRELELSDHLDRTLFSVPDTGVEPGLDDLSQHIVDKLLLKICNDGKKGQ